MSTKNAYDDIRAERERQIAKGRTPDKDDERTTADWDRCLDAVIWNKKNHGERALWVKIASVAVSAIQSHDRLDAMVEAEEQCPCGHDGRMPETCILASQSPVGAGQVEAREPCPRCGGASRPGTVTAGAFTCAACGAVWRLKPPSRAEGVAAERAAHEAAQGRPLSTPWSAAAVEACTDMLAAERESTEPHPRAPGQVWRVTYKPGLSERVNIVKAQGDGWIVVRCDEQGLKLAGEAWLVPDSDLVARYTFERDEPDYGAVEDDGL